MNLAFLNLKKPASLLTILIVLTCIVVAGQYTFFAIHYKVSDLVDSLVQSSLQPYIYQPALVMPILLFLLIQIISYGVFVAGVWFLAISCGEFFKLSRKATFSISILTWFFSIVAILGFNNFYFNHSFYAEVFPLNRYSLVAVSVVLVFLSIIAFLNCLIYKRHRKLGIFFIALIAINFLLNLYQYVVVHSFQPHTSSKPNVILIGLDSVRPDFINYFGQRKIVTPNIDAFLKKSVIFTDAYTPLARTFTSWMSILTSQYPKHHQARNNLANPELIQANETLAKTFQALGYETIYATDEKRFSNITEKYGFDRIIGPGIGVNDFVLGGLSDFPLTNLLINTALGKILFPYNYANRAAAITYDPNSFLQQVQSAVVKHSDKPLFLAVHFCISHWPYTWAHDQQSEHSTLAERYERSVLAVDDQFGKFIKILQKNKLIENSLIVLLSDHGTTAGLPHDRIVNKDKYRGSLKKLSLLTVYKVGAASSASQNFANDFRIDTSYGQGTDVLSLKQYRVLLAMQGFHYPCNVSQRVSLIDIAPTLLAYLKLPAYLHSDGISLLPFISTSQYISRPFFLETGHTISEIEKNDIAIDETIRSGIGVYQLQPQTGLLTINTNIEKSIIRSKQRAVLWGNWLLARYPEMTRTKLEPKQGRLEFASYNTPPFYVIVNLKTQEWSIGLDSPLTKQAPMRLLIRALKNFYGDEITPELR